MSDYIKNIRKKIGNEKIIHPAARILIENKKGEILFIEKLATGNLGIPAGSLEENETIEACIKREVMEECGLEIITLEVIGISSNPQTQTVEYPNGDKIQYFTVEFYSNKWKGEIKIHDTTEIKKADFRDKRYLKQLPANEQSIIESLEHYQKTGKIRLN